MERPWDRWHYFPDTGPDGPNPLPNETQPDAGYPHGGAEIDVEAVSKLQRNPPAEPEIKQASTDDNEPNYGFPPYYQLLRWRHRRQEDATRWQQWWDDLAEKAGGSPEE